MRIVCRKCEGNHLTLNCDKNKKDTNKPDTNKPDGKNKINTTEEKYKNACSSDISNEPTKPNVIFNKFVLKDIRGNNNCSINNTESIQTRNNRYKTFKVKITDLPNDITDNELLELLYEWGDIAHINIKNYKDTSIAYIEFKSEVQADYFIKALDKTYFEYLIINISKL